MSRRFEQHLAIAQFGIQVVEVLIASRQFADARHYARATWAELRKAQSAIANPKSAIR